MWHFTLEFLHLNGKTHLSHPTLGVNVCTKPNFSLSRSHKQHFRKQKATGIHFQGKDQDVTLHLWWFVILRINTILVLQEGITNCRNPRIICHVKKKATCSSIWMIYFELPKNKWKESLEKSFFFIQSKTMRVQLLGCPSLFRVLAQRQRDKS